jgi:hypothetical protein
VVRLSGHQDPTVNSAPTLSRSNDLARESAQRIAVKRAGNYNKLMVIRISEQFEFETRLIDRKALGKGRENLAATRG